MEEEVLGGGDPAGTIEGEAAGGHKTVGVGVEAQVPGPGVEQEGHAQGGLQVGPAQFQDGIAGGLEQDAVKQARPAPAQGP